MVLEASGGLETGLVAELVARNCQPRWSICGWSAIFARATAQLAKTDKLDGRAE